LNDRTLLLVAFGVVLAEVFRISGGGCLADEAAPSPIALLRAVEAARTAPASLSVELSIDSLSPPPERTLHCLIDVSGERRRFEVLEGDVPRQVVIRDGDVFFQYRNVKHEDIEVFDARMATGSRGTLAFDPRLLGLSDTMLCDIEVRNCLWYENCDHLEVVGREAIHGAQTWRVHARRGRDSADYWIEEPSFRVHRKVVLAGTIQIEIDSEFGNANVVSPFPSTVMITRTGKETTRIRYSVKKFIPTVSIDPGTFAMKSLGAPRNTAISDYRTSQITGYWDGEKISLEPVPPGEALLSSELPPASRQRTRGALIWLNVGVVCLFGLAFIGRNRRRKSQTKPES